MGRIEQVEHGALAVAGAQRERSARNSAGSGFHGGVRIPRRRARRTADRPRRSARLVSSGNEVANDKGRPSGTSASGHNPGLDKTAGRPNSVPIAEDRDPMDPDEALTSREIGPAASAVIQRRDGASPVSILRSCISVAQRRLAVWLTRRCCGGKGFRARFMHHDV